MENLTVITPVMKQLNERFPKFFEWWDASKIRSLRFREGDIDLIHEMFGKDLLITGIITLLAFTHGDCYPIVTIKEIFDVPEEQVAKIIADLCKRHLVYSEMFLHPEKGLPFYYAEREVLYTLVKDYKLKSLAQIKRLSLQNERPLLIFVSSVMDKDVEDLNDERHAVREGIEALSFATPWLFEDSPASSEPLPDQFLRKVKQSDFFVLIVGKHVTDSVEREFQTAKKCNVRSLVFLKENTERSEKTQSLLKSIDFKYQTFSDKETLRMQVTASLVDEVLRATRRGLSQKES